MGRISQRLVNVLRRRSARRDQGLNAELQEFARGLFDAAPTVSNLLQDGYDPLHVKYILGHEFAIMFSDAMPEYKEFDEYFDLVVDAENHYVADPDETTPVTGSYFSLWSLFDLRFGADRETIGTCLLDLLTDIQADPTVLRLMRALSDSRMSVFQHQGSDGPYVRLRELVTGRELRCHSTSGRAGSPGELWFVRLGPPLDEAHDYYVTLSTPYVLTDATVDDWTAYLNKSLLTPEVGQPQNLHELLKFGKQPMSWHGFLVRAFQYADDHAVYLAGLPDVPSSLPNARSIDALQPNAVRPATELVQERVSLELTAVQLRALQDLLPEVRDVPVCKSHKPAAIGLLRLYLRRLEERVPLVLNKLNKTQRKPYERLLEAAESDRKLVTGQAVYELRIELDYTDPKVWRENQTYDCTFDALHNLIQAAMGWDCSHLYDFSAAGVMYSLFSEELEAITPNRADAETTFLSQAVLLGNRPFLFKYTYDFGDNWEHTITVQRIVAADEQVTYPVCLAGGGACPPEDCGGVDAYQDLLEALSDPDNDQHDDAVESLGRFDPTAFNAKTATRTMRRCLEP
jgi:hypothetical protein